MTSLTETAQSLKKFAPILLFGLIIIILIGLIIYRFTSKPDKSQKVLITPPSINQDPDQKQPAAFDFSGLQIPGFPEKLPVYTVSPYNITEAAAGTLASNLGFSGAPSSVKENTPDGRKFGWDQENLSLTVGQTRLEYHNNEYRSRSTLSTSGLPQDELKNSATSFMEKIALLGGDLELKKTEYQVVSGNYRLPVGKFEDAQIIEFSFDKQLSGISLTDNYPGSGFSRARVTKDGGVIYLFSRYFDKFSESGLYDLKTSKEAIEGIRSDQGRVVQTQVFDEKGIPANIYERPENIENAKIEKVSLAYFLPNDIKDMVQPIFVFEGNFKTAKNESGRAVIYLPAIKQAK